MGTLTNSSGGHALLDTSKQITRVTLDGCNSIDEVVCEILSRLPVKPLMRFKCVCKGWLNLIEEDSYFIHLHLVRSKARQSLLYVNEIGDGGQECARLDEFLLTADLSLEGISRSTIRTENLFCLDEILGPINGLICFVDEHKYAVCIYNVSTREASPWVISSRLLDEKEKHPERSIHDYTIRFGFDPTTKEHKVLSMFNIDVLKASKHLKEASDDDYIEVCEILTLGDSTWRRIDEVPPCYLGDPLPWVYVNGSIYWCTCKGVIAFDVGIEKFRMFCIPDYIRQPFYKYSNPDLFLVELDGRVGIVCRVSAYVLKLCTYEDNTKSKRNTPVGTVGDGIWTEETITLPFPVNRHRILRILSVNGTYKIILLTSEWRIYLHSYDRKEKSFTRIRSRRGSSSIPNDCWMNNFSPLVESLIRVRKKRSSNEVITLDLAALHSPEPSTQKPVDPLIAPSSPVSRHTRSATQRRQASTQSVAQRTRSKRLNIE